MLFLQFKDLSPEMKDSIWDMALLRRPCAHDVMYAWVNPMDPADTELITPVDELGMSVDVSVSYKVAEDNLPDPEPLLLAATPLFSHPDLTRVQTIRTLMQTCRESRSRAIRAAATKDMEQVGFDIAPDACLTPDTYCSRGRLVDIDDDDDLIIIPSILRRRRGQFNGAGPVYDFSPLHFPLASKIEKLAIPIHSICEQLLLNGTYEHAMQEALSETMRRFPNLQEFYVLVDPAMTELGSYQAFHLWSIEELARQYTDDFHQRVQQFQEGLEAAEAEATTSSAAPCWRWRGWLDVCNVARGARSVQCECNASTINRLAGHCGTQRRLVEYSVVPSAVAAQAWHFQFVMAFLAWFGEQIAAHRRGQGTNDATSSSIRVGLLTWRLADSGGRGTPRKISSLYNYRLHHHRDGERWFRLNY